MMADFHDRNNVTLRSLLSCSYEEAHQLARIQITDTTTLLVSKAQITPIPNNPNMCLVSMGNIFQKEALERFSHFRCESEGSRLASD